jgi:hypothetical protein
LVALVAEVVKVVLVFPWQITDVNVVGISGVPTVGVTVIVPVAEIVPQPPVKVTV